MRVLLTNLLLLISIVGVQAQTESERWFRPVNVGKAEFKDAIVDGDTIRFFKGEWVQTKAEGVGDLILSGKELLVDAQSIGAWRQRANDVIHAPLELKYAASVDTIKVTYNGLDTIPCLVISQTRNTILNSEFQVPGEIVLSGLDKESEVLRFAPQNRVSETVDVANIEGYGIPLPEPEPKPIEPTPEPTNYVIYNIGIGILVLLIIGGVVFFVAKRKRNAKRDSQQEENDEEVRKGEINHQHTKQAPKTETTTPKGENLQEKVKRYKRELAEERRKVRNLTDEKASLEHKLKRANDALATAEEKVVTVSSELKTKYEKQIEDINADMEVLKNRHSEEISVLNKRINECTEELTKTHSELDNTKLQLSNTETALTNAKADIESLSKSLTKFNTILSEVPFAMEYATKVGELLKIADEINASALNMLNLEVEDPYNLMKYISRYAKTISTLDMQTLNAELKMLEKGNMVLVGSTLATYNKSNSEEDLKNSTCQYFFTSYLQKLIDGLVVLNESMAGADHLVDGVRSDDVKIFAKYRTQLQEQCTKLGIVVENVRLFDKVGEKIDLSAQLVDIGCSTGDIVDMENAVVYLNGSRRPEVKVRVKVQE